MYLCIWSLFQREAPSIQGFHVRKCLYTANSGQGTYLSALSRRLAARRGKKRASMAGAHSIVVSAFQRLSRNQRYQALGADDFDSRRRDPLVDRLTRRIEPLG